MGSTLPQTRQGVRPRIRTPVEFEDLFRKNHFAKGRFVALGRKLDLKESKIPLYLLAGGADEITTKEQIFNAEMLVGARTDEIVKKLVPGGHIGLFMGSHTLTDTWPGIGRWIHEHDSPDRARRTVR